MFKAILTKIVSIVVGVIGLSLPIHIQNPQNSETISTSTPEITKNIISTTTPEIKKDIQSTPTKTVVKPIVQKTEIKKDTPKQETPTQTPTPQTDFEALNTLVRKAVVNIFCTTKTSGSLYPVTGTGVVVSDTGVILTNAHLGQYFLLKDFNGQKDYVQCIIRTGNPAYPTYNAELVYISPTWISENKNVLNEQNPQGTGEHDYAFLRITGKIDGSKMDSIPFISLNIKENNKPGLVTLLASYPAGFLGGQSILQGLYQSSSITSISDVYTFGSTTIDLISVKGTVVSQKGSSGGAVTNEKGELIGLITTESDATKTSDRDLRAITTAYINRDLKNDYDQNLIDILTFPEQYAENFNKNIAPQLTEILTNAILKK